MHVLVRALTHALLPLKAHAVTTALLHSASARAAQNSLTVLSSGLDTCCEWVVGGGVSISVEPAAHPSPTPAKPAPSAAAKSKNALLMTLSFFTYLTTMVVS
jgi:hypothetical protein